MNEIRLVLPAFTNLTPQEVEAVNQEIDRRENKN
jgi:hypothetical protein